MSSEEARARGQRSEEAGAAFEQRVADLYRLLGYKVEHGRNFSSRQVDLFLSKCDADLTIVRAIECKTSEVTADVLDRFLIKLSLVRLEYPSAHGTVITALGYTDAVAEHAAKAGIMILRFMDLASRAISGFEYASRLRDTIASSDRYSLRNYVSHRVAETTDAQAIDAMDFVEDWLQDPQSNHLTVLGDAGTGKTFLTLVLTHRLAERYLSDPVKFPLPIRIDLRNADRLIKLEGLILTHLAEQGLSGVSFDVLMHVLTRGGIVLILDGFDEMAARVTPSILANNFEELARGAKGLGKVIVTSRTEYFKSRTEVEEVVLGAGQTVDDSARELFFEVIARKGFRMAYLRPFEASQIEAYVRNVGGENWTKAMEKIRRTYNLLELSQRPLLLEMIVKTIDRLKDAEVNRATLYRVYTGAWVQREQWRGVLTSTEKMEFVKTLAVSLWTTKANTIHYSDLTTYIAESLAKKIREPQHLAEFDNHIRTAAFLVRDDHGHYGFAHKSFKEYFLADYIANKLRSLAVDVLRMPSLSLEIVGFLADMIDEPAVRSSLEAVLRGGYVEQVSENAVLCLYGLQRFRRVAEGLPFKGIALPEGMDLPRAKLGGVSLEGATLRGCNFAGAELSGVRFLDCDLQNAVLDEARLDSADLTRADLSDVSARGAVMTRAVLAATILDRIRLDGAALEGAVLMPVSIRDAVLEDVTLMDAEMSDAVLEVLPRNLRIAVPENALYTTEAWHRYAELVTREVLRAVGDHGVAADAVGEVWLALMSNFEPGRELSTDVVRGVARRYAMAADARRRRATIMDSRDLDRMTVGPTQHQDAVDHEAREALDACLGKLSPRAQNVVRGVMDGLAITDIARRCSMSASAVAQLWRRAMSQLRTCMAGHSFEH
jgi:RNA polymerase sigma factor (sigma-70 family)